MTGAELMAYVPLFRSEANKRVGMERADDLVQDTLAEMWEHRETHDPSRGSLGSWGRVILQRLVSQEKRRGRGKIIAASGEIDETDPAVARAIKREPNQEYYADVVLVTERLKHLTDKQASVIMGLAVGSSISEIAAERGTSFTAMQMVRDAARTNLVNPPKKPLGQRAGRKGGITKLSDTQIQEIRELAATGLSDIKLGALYNVSPKMIWRIKNTEVWAHVEAVHRY